MYDKQMNDKTLEELENDFWGKPKMKSHLVTECHRLRKVPLNQFNVENLRIMLGQGSSVKYLLPIAIQKLEKDPLAEGDFYPGDLLSSVIRLPVNELSKYQELYAKLKDIVNSLQEIPEEIIEEVHKFKQSV